MFAEYAVIHVEIDKDPAAAAERLAGHGGELDSEPTSLAEFAVELENVVARLEAQWNGEHLLRRETADEVHRLRARADGIFHADAGA